MSNSMIKISIFIQSICCLIFLLFQPSQVEAALPENFQKELVVSTGLDGPSGFGIAPDGRIFILERTGKIKIFKNGQLLFQPFADLPSIASGDRGLIGIEFDPNFFDNHYVYFYYTGLDELNRLVRFDASEDTAQEGPFILYQTTFPSEQLHVGGSIQFGSDGKLYFAVGDNGYHPNAQDLTNPHGKILRINKDGTIPSDNPFIGQSNVLPEIWAYGFRNPWRFQFDSVTSKMYGSDVGEATIEEINRIERGKNYGWPLCEGLCATPNPNFIDPIYSYNHEGGSAAATGGPVYRANLFPPEYYGRYFFGDYAKGFIKTITLDEQGNNIGVSDFDLNAGSVVELKVAPDGSLYYLTYIPGALYKVTYSTGNHIPSPNASADTLKGIEPLTVNFSSAGTTDPDGDPLIYQWDFGDGSSSSNPNPTKTYTQKGKFFVHLTVSDGTHSVPAHPLVIQVGLPPTVNIGAPANNSTFKAGDTIFYTASAVDGAGFDISDANYTTEVVFHHQTHIHPFLGPLHGNKTGNFQIPDTGEPSADIWYEIKVTATDSNGLSDTKSVRINPITSNITFTAQPAGLQVLVDGIPTNTPTTIPMVVGFKRELSIIPFQKSGLTYYTFHHWSDGEAMRHTISTPETTTSYIATYTEAAGYSAEYFNNPDLIGAPVLTRHDQAIDFEWGDNSPTPELPNDFFSVRWTGNQFFNTGKYKFITQTDDGVRLYIDGELIIDEWHDQGGTSHEVTLTLLEGNHDIKMEYYESGGGAMAKLNWELTPDTSGYSAQYFANQTLSGQPTITKVDPDINFVWNDASPDPAIPVDHFSVRWTKVINFVSGTYRFTTSADDGVRIYIDDELVLDKWIDQPATTYTVDENITGGNHTIKIEYYENGGSALMMFNYEQIAINTPPDTGYQSEYFDNQTLSSTPKLTRIDPEINFVWNDASPDPLIPPDHFSARWIKTSHFTTGTYTFTTRSDDGVRVYIDNELILDKWIDQPTTTHTAEKIITDGIHTLKVEYYENGGGAVMIFGYEKTSDTETPPTDAAYTAEYWNLITDTFPPAFPNTTPTITREDSTINFTWNDTSPDPSIQPDNFAARWRKIATFTEGLYTFTLTSDDGSRLYIDGELIIDHWTDHPTTTKVVEKQIAAGNHLITIEYYEHEWDAIMQFQYEKQLSTESAFTGEYFDNQTLSGTPVLTRSDANINFIWNDSSPDVSIPPDHFSVRWTKNHHFAAGSYTFTLKSDDGIRFWIDNQLLVDDWTDHSMLTYTSTVILTEGIHEIKVEYYENSGGAVAILE